MDTTKLLLYNQRCVNKSTTWILFLFWGGHTEVWTK